MHLARQVYPENSNRLYKAYVEATERPHGYLVLYLSQDTDDLLRFRTNILPETDIPPEERTPPIVYTKIEDGTSEIKLSRPPRAKKSPTQTAKSDRLALRRGTRQKYMRVRAERVER